MIASPQSPTTNHENEISRAQMQFLRSSHASAVTANASSAARYSEQRNLSKQHPASENLYGFAKKAAVTASKFKVPFFVPTGAFLSKCQPWLDSLNF